LPESEKSLKDGITFEIMDKVAFAVTGNQSVDRLQQAHQSLFKTTDEREISADLREVESKFSSGVQNSPSFRIFQYWKILA
jgi:hypothetical protein